MTQFRNYNGVKFEVRWTNRAETQVVVPLEDCEVVIRVVDNVVREVSFSGALVRPTDLHSLPLEGLVQEALSHFVIEETRPDGEIVRRVRTRPTRASRKAVERARPRTTMTPSKLEAIASAYLRGGNAAVQQELSASESTAKRYVKAARDAGYDLPRRSVGRPKGKPGGIDNEAT